MKMSVTFFFDLKSLCQLKNIAHECTSCIQKNRDVTNTSENDQNGHGAAGRISLDAGARAMATPLTYARIPRAREGRGVCARVNFWRCTLYAVSTCARRKERTRERTQRCYGYSKAAVTARSLPGLSILTGPFRGTPHQFRPSLLKTLENCVQSSI